MTPPTLFDEMHLASALFDLEFTSTRRRLAAKGARLSIPRAERAKRKRRAKIAKAARRRNRR